MLWSASVLSATSSDTEPTIVLNFDTGKYIFNVGENTGRSFMQGRRGWKNAKAIFLTSVGTQRTSGLPGLFMLLADASFKQMNVIGPSGLAHYLASMRTYVYRSGIQVKPREVDSSTMTPTNEPSPVYQDQQMTVYAIPLLPVGSNAIDTATKTPAGDSIMSKRRRTPSPDSAAKRQRTAQHSSEPLPGPFSTSKTLFERSQHPDFMPSDLRGEDAQEWRHLVVQSMFPSKNTPAKAPTPKKGKRRQENNRGDDKTSTDTPTDRLREVPAVPTSNAIISPRPKGRRLPPALDIHPVPRLCYVCVGAPVRGKFDAIKAKELGLPIGPIRNQLTKGETVTFMVDDGQGGKVERSVRPEECMGPTEPSRVTIIIDIVSPDQIPQLMSYFTESPFYSQFRSKTEDGKESPVSAVFHLCGEDVLEDARYKEFMNGFANSVNHIVSSRKHSPDPVTFTHAAFVQLKLNQLDSEMFPLQTYRTEPIKSITEEPELPSNTFVMRSNMQIDLRPSRPPFLEEDNGSEIEFRAAVSSSTPLELPPPLLNAFAKAKAQYAELQAQTNSETKPGDDVLIVPLGTSSAMPNLYRNVSSTLVQIPGWGSVLLDCGEGTWGQLVRLFGDDPAGSDGVYRFLRELKCIFISHIHGDHHIGLAKILTMRRRLNPPPSEHLYVVGVRHVLLYLREMADIEDLALDAPGGVVTILSDALSRRRSVPYPDRGTMYLEPWTDRDVSQAAAVDMCRSLGLTSFTTVEVNHGTRCYGVVLKHSDGWSIVFSADTLPTDNLVYAGQNATLLIHEATMADDQEDAARDKMHSTFGQAVEIGRRMNAENILLTHFSARYPKMPQSEAAPAPQVNAPQSTGTATQEDDELISDQRDSNKPKPTLGLAFDHTRIRIGDMRKLKAYLPAIEQSFVDTLEEDGEEPDPAQEPW